MQRDKVLDELAAAIAAVRPGHPVRVAIDGVDCAGKTVLANELIAPLTRLDRPVIRVSVDGFHRPRQQRYARGADSPEGYYHDTTDYAALRREVLDPLGPGGTRSYRVATFDFRTEQPVESPTQVAPADAVLLLDGVFLLRPELADAWDFRIFVRASFATTLDRATRRDGYLFGSVEAITDRYVKRYIPGQRIYLHSARPEDSADVIVINDDPASPQLAWRQPAPRRNEND
jgi:uridine kinase